MSFANPFASKRQAGYPEAIDRVKVVVRQVFDLRDNDTVSVTEVSCNEPGCPDVETVIALLRKGEKPLIGRVHKPIPQVDPADVREAFDTSQPKGNAGE